MRTRFWWLAGLMALAGGVALSAADWDAVVVPLDAEWRTVIVAHESRPAGPPSDDATGARDVSGVADRWSVADVPETVAGPRRLVFACFRARVEVWVGSNVVYAFDDESAEGRRTVHVADLGFPGGHVVAIRLARAGYGSSFDGPPILAVPDKTPEAIARLSTDALRRDLGRAAAGIVVIAIGLASIIVSLVRFRHGDRTLLWFGVFTLLYGVRLTLDSAYAPALGVPQLVRWHMISALTYLINVPATLFTLQIFGRGVKSSVLWTVRASSVFFVIGLAADLFAGEPFAADRVNNVLVLANGLVLVANLAGWKARRTADGVILTGGIVVFGLLALFENLRGLFDVLPWAEGLEWLGFVALMTSLGWVALRRFLRGEAELIEIGKELEMARAIQTSILPDQPPQSTGLEVRARYVPMTAVAGDFYDWYEMLDGKVGVLVADVSGHGVPAAMVASMVKVAAATHAAESSDPAELMSMLNRTLCQHLGREFVTVTWLVFDPAARTVRVCNAGHPPPLRLTNGSVQPIGGFGILVGKFRNAKYKAATIELSEGDRILCFTDGITEAASASLEEYGFQRLENALASSRSLELDAALDNLVAEVKWWAGKAPQGDDLTVVGIDVGSAQR